MPQHPDPPTHDAALMPARFSQAPDPFSALAVLARNGRNSFAAWVTEMPAGTSAPKLVCCDAATDFDDRALHAQITGLMRRSDIGPGHPVMLDGRAPISALVCLDSSGAGSHPYRLWLGAAEVDQLDTTVELARLAALIQLTSDTPDRMVASMLDALHADALARLEELRARISAIFAGPSRPIAMRLTDLLVAAAMALDMEYGYVARRAGRTLRIRHHSGPAPSSDLDDLSSPLSEFVLSSATPLILADVAASRFAGSRDSFGNVPGAFLGVRIVFDGQVLGTLELCSPQPRSAGFAGWNKLVLTMLSTFTAPFLFLMD